MLDKQDLSIKNNWFDEHGRVYIIYTIEQIMEDLNCGNKKAGQLLQELEEKACLIEKKRQGLGKPNLIYVKNFISVVDNTVERICSNRAYPMLTKYDYGSVKVLAILPSDCHVIVTSSKAKRNKRKEIKQMFKWDHFVPGCLGVSIPWGF